jgi:rare lipoprotein A
MSVARLLLAGCVLIVLATGCASTPRTGKQPISGMGLKSASVGIASYYANKYHGKKTASGERYNMHALTAAHRTLPFGSNVRITNLDNDRSVTVRINDRGPFVGGRIIDVSLEAARRLQMVSAGTARVRLETHPPAPNKDSLSAVQ